MSRKLLIAAALALFGLSALDGTGNAAQLQGPSYINVIAPISPTDAFLKIGANCPGGKCRMKPL